MKKIALFIIIALLIAGGFKLIKGKKEEISNERKAFVHVYKPLETKQKESLDNFETFSAKLEAVQNPKISTKISGHITKIFVEENQEIKKGQKLVSIDDLEYKQTLLQLSYSINALKSSVDSFISSLNSLKLDMQLSLKEFETNKKLYKIGGISKDKLDFSEVIYEQKKAKYNSTLKTIESKKNEQNSQQAFLDSKKKLKEYYSLKSPIDGFIEEILVDIGDLSSVNKPILSLVSKEQKLSFLFASENIKQNQEVYIDNKKIGVIESINISAKNYMKEANIKLDKNLSNPINSLISIKVRIK
ncbi:HlyD family secretion protein [Arcobacter arenosus]|uniref:Biotin/lipoyl-binding protein n=1 Tax=Arcobacter arenosus TaxID=2576037 RepID=A0A5R8Y446_9BACT|nr:biotin/lipoyl-binding protein [Arcobacter arenosus]TLP40865.1 biotin/lipoyl-binding protein [Arcobacter arenosus]